MRYGKLTTAQLQENIINNLKVNRKETILSAGQGEDCAALNLDGTILLSSDPITCKMPIENLGSLAVDVCCNDIVANGGEPVALMLTIILPPNCTEKDVGIIVKDAVAAAERINVDIVGGHTEFSDCVIRPIVSATAIGVTKRLLKKSDLKVGDKLYVTKYVAMEGTTIFNSDGCSSREKALINDFRAALSVIKEGKILRQYNDITIMHDITEGGIIGAIAEVCLSNNFGAKIFKNQIPIHPLTLRLCAEQNINPYRLISSGSMLFATSSGEAAIAELQNNGIMVTCVGEVTNGNIEFITDAGTEIVDVLPDEMYNISNNNITKEHVNE